MSSSDLAISVRALSKAYVIRHNQPTHTTLAEALVERVKHPFRSSTKEKFWALQDVSFDIHKGEIVGVIGRNGAGKSTLLKILSRITRPTAGVVDLYGRVGSLLEVGTGFHQELSGRENIYLNGSILGMDRREVAQQFDAIVDFAGVQQFLDTPVKRYSSGMYVRLAFAVAAHLNPEVLIIDEVLAVGDLEFQKKCLEKIRQVATGGRTVLLVSHHVHSIALLCKLAIVLDQGHLCYFGETDKAIDIHLKNLRQPRTTQENSGDNVHRVGTGEYRFVAMRGTDTSFDSGEPLSFIYKIRHHRGTIGKMFVAAKIISDEGIEIAHCDSRLTGYWLDDSTNLEGKLVIKSPWLKPGNYRLDVHIATMYALVDVCQGICEFQIAPILPYAQGGGLTESLRNSVVLADFEWNTLDVG